jgi:hypothetical protein
MAESIYFLKPGLVRDSYCRPLAGTRLTARYKSPKVWVRRFGEICQFFVTNRT